MQLTRVVSFFFALAVGVAAIPTADPVAIDKRDLVSSIESALTAVEGDLNSAITQVGKPRIDMSDFWTILREHRPDNLVQSGEATVNSITPILETVISDLNSVTGSITGLDAGLEKRQLLPDLGTLLATVVTDVVTLVTTVLGEVLTDVATLLTELDTALAGVVAGVETDVPGTTSTDSWAGSALLLVPSGLWASMQLAALLVSERVAHELVFPLGVCL